MAFVVIAFFFGLAGGVIGKIKGSSFFLWFLIAAIPPFIGLVAAVLYRNEYDQPHRRCPTCRKVVPLHDALCTRCGTELEFAGSRACAGRTGRALTLDSGLPSRRRRLEAVYAPKGVKAHARGRCRHGMPEG